MSGYCGRVVGERPGRPGLQVKIMVRQMILAGFVVFLPAGLQGQGRGMMASVPRAAAVGPRMVMPARSAAAVRAMPAVRTGARSGTVRPRTTAPTARSTRTQNGTRRHFDRFGDEDNRFRPGCSSAPGLGFDAVHQAATCGSGTLGARGFGAGGGFFFPIFDGGFPVAGSSVSGDEGPVAESAPPDVTDAEQRGRGRRYRAPEPETAPAAESASAAADNEPYVFVKRDGTVFFAVAYSWEKGSLRYITSEGLRRVVTQDALDLDATRQFNEQRGLNFRSPA
jgi:hypothetical protein